MWWLYVGVIWYCDTIYTIMNRLLYYNEIVVRINDESIYRLNIVLKRKTWTLRLGLVLLMWSASLILSKNVGSAVSMILKQECFTKTKT